MRAHAPETRLVAWVSNPLTPDRSPKGKAPTPTAAARRRCKWRRMLGRCDSHQSWPSATAARPIQRQSGTPHPAPTEAADETAVPCQAKGAERVYSRHERRAGPSRTARRRRWHGRGPKAWKRQHSSEPGPKRPFSRTRNQRRRKPRSPSATEALATTTAGGDGAALATAGAMTAAIRLTTPVGNGAELQRSLIRRRARHPGAHARASLIRWSRMAANDGVATHTVAATDAVCATRSMAAAHSVAVVGRNSLGGRIPQRGRHPQPIGRS